MRIIAGKHKGRKLQTPKGKDTRPTSERAREALMSALMSECGGFKDAVVLDAFAGSGALALEVLSRGGMAACLVDCAPSAIKAIKANVDALGYENDAVCVMHGDIFKTMPCRFAFPYNLVLLDPPYAMASDRVFALLGRLDGLGLLEEAAVVFYEHAASADAMVLSRLEGSAFSLASRRGMSSTTLDIFRREKAADISCRQMFCLTEAIQKDLVISQAE